MSILENFLGLFKVFAMHSVMKIMMVNQAKTFWSEPEVSQEMKMPTYLAQLQASIILSHSSPRDHELKD